MIPYELAKQLKDAGFPQDPSWTQENQMPSRYFAFDGKTIRYRHIANENEIKIPTLSELIEACGEDFGVLEKELSKWCAYDSTFLRDDDGTFWEQKGEGPTPEEAVANLWLALNVVLTGG